jgi:uncharacterized protein YndB with AHSA1/START domain
MDDLRLEQVPIMKTGMLIRKSVSEVFEAFINPDITTKFWFSKSSGRLGARILFSACRSQSIAPA